MVMSLLKIIMTFMMTFATKLSFHGNEKSPKIKNVDLTLLKFGSKIPCSRYMRFIYKIQTLDTMATDNL